MLLYCGNLQLALHGAYKIPNVGLIKRTAAASRKARGTCKSALNLFSSIIFEGKHMLLDFWSLLLEIGKEPSAALICLILPLSSMGKVSLRLLVGSSSR